MTVNESSFFRLDASIYVTESRHNKPKKISFRVFNWIDFSERFRFMILFDNFWVCLFNASLNLMQADTEKNIKTLEGHSTRNLICVLIKKVSSNIFVAQAILNGLDAVFPPLLQWWLWLCCIENTIAFCAIVDAYQKACRKSHNDSPLSVLITENKEICVVVRVFAVKILFSKLFILYFFSFLFSLSRR